ncbi:DUF5317 family protein [Clostridium chauvoei]|uniref:Uncharacterized protein n=2 Tax=Clostridium chauvoei TaxID=46867 RepID=A0A1U6JKG2_9CLOT|nr:DUF5317 family protein [Clostridium chauvoei]ATD55626.1 hypothetical protein BTM20_10415 [Clostridium chauvoei]ATD56697.1 hypothetical protein BTM21_02605 [Clostridium chauvoei]MBX7280137.1 DUF5317 domain-containing protein [Clostridium chauvoei]MBX7282621.1 DUF5317 domain-containing protein [Clostridium chauvoei]MBX7285028.1 DUF5317 domain-containing protein [Clostridium chauvoei]
MIETIIIALIFSKIKGYKIKTLFKNWTIYPIIIMEIVYIFIQANIFNGNYQLIKYVGVLKTIYLCTYIPMIFKYNQYMPAITGAVFTIVGGFLNNIAIRANNGKMPVFPTVSHLTGYIKADSFIKINDIHILGTSATNLKFLTDIFDIGYGVLSIGDIFIRFYVFIIIYKSIQYINKLEKI